MAKMLAQKDFDLTQIGKRFELDEVIPVYRMENRTDENGVVILDKDEKPRSFATDEIIGYNYSVTIIEGEFRKKATQVKIMDTHPPITNEEIMAVDSVKCYFKNLEVSMAGNPMYYRAEEIVILEPKKKAES